MMKKQQTVLSRREFLSGSAALAGVGLLAACAPKPTAAPPTQAPAEQPTQPPAEAPTAAPPAAEAMDLGLLLVDWNDAFRTILENEIIPAFQDANPGLTVIPDFTDWGNLDPKVMTAFAGGLAPDVFQADNVEFGPKYYPQGIVAELDAVVEASGAKALLNDFYTKAIEEGAKTNGKLVCIPYVLDNRGLFVRKDFLAEVGLETENFPGNWAEFRDAAIKMTKRTDDTWERAGWHSNTGFACFQTFVQFLWQNGGSILNEAMDKTAFNSPEGVEALALWTDLIRKDKVGPVENLENVGDLSPINAGISAMAFGGYWTMTNARDYAPDVLPNLSVVIMEQKVKGALWYANTYFCTKNDHVDTSWKLLSFLTLNDDNFLKYHEAMGGLPPRKSTVERASYITPNHLVLIEDVMAAPGAHTTPAVPFTLEVLQRVDEAIERSIRGEATPQEALDQAADEGNQIIDRYKSGG
jgi:multiple sugar transport system substrate-binding protein